MDAMVAVDLDDSAEALLTQAVAWAAHMQARLHLRTASHMLWDPDTVFGDTESAALATEWERRRRQEVVRLEQLFVTIPDAMRGSVEVLQGRPHEVIPGEALKHDVLMIGTHARAGLERLFLGSVAERVVRSSAKPVLVLHLDDPPVDLDRRLRVLCPIDADEPRMRAVLASRRLLDCDLHVVYALADLRLYEAAGLLGSTPDSPDRHPHRAWAEEQLRELMREHSLDLELHFVVRTAENPAADLAAFAETVGADLLAIPTHGRSGMERLAYGSVAERLVRLAPCPVLVVR